MLDPFPAVPQWASKATVPLADYFALPTLPLHIHEVIGAALFYYFVQTRVSPWLSPKLSPKHYPNLNPRTKLNWDVHVVSLVQSVLVCAIAVYVMLYDDERRNMNTEERVWGYTGGTGLVEAMGLGYFVYDLWITVQNIGMFGIGMLFHAISALTVFSFGFRPFVNYYAPDFILYELSSPFLNIHWFCDKLDMTGSTVQLINGIFLITTFISCRLVWGTYASYRVFRDVIAAYRGTIPATEGASSLELMRYAGKKEAPLWLCFTYAASNVTLNSLNWYWINKMIATIRKRFDPPFGTRKPEEKPKADYDVARGVYADGTKTVEVDATLRRRPTVQRNLTELPVA
ncbi:uncharacterized protein PV09_01459 [Verruconis gallopava]|uniref:TLC domain-containing protein n=1 Tax=Verruconis gallopava TaxID=253628 RepID=A0A0D2B8G4_9PEZI|nr:uncharacterized protein PV09_01459 [Verruconis gallopava]KIW07494.1 hypothetical protein PV09_01459 [Verruconis gallopava]